MPELRILGPVELRRGPARIDLGPPRQRAVLAALAVDVGRPVGSDTLIDRVWGEQPPDNVRATLYSLVSRLRARLRPLQAGPADQPLRRAHGGYLLDVDPDTIDLHRARALAERARPLPGRPADPARSAPLLREAAALWTAEPLAGLPGDWAQRQRRALREERVTILAELFATELRLGRHEAATGPLAAAVAEHPFAENLVRLWMLALCRSGNPAAALAVYDRTRRGLADELGVEPGPGLKELHGRILRQDDAVANTPTARREAARSADPQPASEPTGTRPHALGALQPPPDLGVVPRQLPAAPGHFTGRAPQLARLDELLSGHTAAHPGVVPVAVLTGTAGIGKTALTVRWAHRVADRFPDGQLFLDLRGFDPTHRPVRPTEALRTLLTALGVPHSRIPADGEAQAGLYRSLMARRRALLVLDNARDADQVRPLLPGGPGNLVIAASRARLSGLLVQGAQPITLDLLTPAEAERLLALRLGEERALAEPAALRQIIDTCAGLPLALAVAASRAAARPEFPLTAVAKDLHDVDTRLDALADPDPAVDVRAVFSWSYQALSPEAARLFRLLGLHPGPDLTPDAAAALAGLPLPQTTALLTELADAVLLIESRPRRYAFHDLLRAYAAELAEAHDDHEDRRRARHRMLDYYVHSAHAADRRLDPSRTPLDLDPTDVAPATPPDAEAAQDWFAAELEVLLAAVEHAAAHGFDRQCWRLAWGLPTHLDRHGRWHDLAAVWETALAATRRAGDLAAQASGHRFLGYACTRLGRFADAHAHLDRAMEDTARLGDLVGQAHALRGRGHVHQSQERYAEALDCNRRALALYAAAGERACEASALNSIGWFHALLGEYPQALDHCERALVLMAEVGDRFGEIATLDSLGYALRRLGRHDEAVARYRLALDLLGDLDLPAQKATILDGLAEAQRAIGDLAGARRSWLRALELFDELDHPDADAVRARLDAL
ncbi:BTAD domain-containing putative transcriptional regulator [Glycomyces sp. NPDC046736]|uniref:AfsR/SARP family transcriptional regulator n=1 Tax=Glycomyces sp. NPDC046736 TaxID=3155615 RepID=UPI0033FAA540